MVRRRHGGRRGRRPRPLRRRQGARRGRVHGRAHRAERGGSPRGPLPDGRPYHDVVRPQRRRGDRHAKESRVVGQAHGGGCCGRADGGHVSAGGPREVATNHEAMCYRQGVPGLDAQAPERHRGGRGDRLCEGRDRLGRQGRGAAEPRHQRLDRLQARGPQGGPQEAYGAGARAARSVRSSYSNPGRTGPPRTDPRRAPRRVRRRAQPRQRRHRPRADRGRHRRAHCPQQLVTYKY
mmetsp:Transcript_3987/g.11300  ORF Transcript_3987/g.11300 Transcript_3987/m.11300 type:complete len:236 (+) Transcript_3987:357-1064(+)